MAKSKPKGSKGHTTPSKTHMPTKTGMPPFNPTLTHLPSPVGGVPSLMPAPAAGGPQAPPPQSPGQDPYA